MMERTGFRSARRLFHCALTLTGLLRPNLSATVEPKASPPGAPDKAIRILSYTALPPALAKATDVRWASDDSVYLALRDQGVVEVRFDPAKAPPKTIVPGRAQLGGFWYSTLVGASARHLVAGAPAMTFTSVDLGTKSRRDEIFGRGPRGRDDRLKACGLENSLVYYSALRKAGVPAELHVYVKGGHAFGLRPTESPITPSKRKGL